MEGGRVGSMGEEERYRIVCQHFIKNRRTIRRNDLLKMDPVLDA